MHVLNEVMPFWMTVFPTSVINLLTKPPVSSIKKPLFGCWYSVFK